MATSVNQHGIRWNLDGDYEVGQFVNGDWYVVGPATVDSIDHFISGVWTPIGPFEGRSGSMINPLSATQAYDSRCSPGKPSEYVPSLAVEFPRELVAGESLVSTISIRPEELSGVTYTAAWSGDRFSVPQFGSLKTAAVLTCLAEAPPAGSFRPPYYGTNKPLYNISQIDASKWGQFAPPANAVTLLGPTRQVSFFERGLQRVWLNHIPVDRARQIHPAENMYNYHREIGEFLSTAALLMVTTMATETLRNYWIQNGIDAYHSIIAGNQDSSTFEWVTIYTGILLQDEDMAKCWVEGSSQTTGRATEKFYYWANKASTRTSDIVPPGTTWTGASVFFRKQIGNAEHEHLHPSEWEAKVVASDGYKNESYRQDHDSRPHFGMLLASAMMGAEEYWPDNAPRDYMVRWQTEPFTTDFLPIIKLYFTGNEVRSNAPGMGNREASFKNAMWDLYKSYAGVGPPPADTSPPNWSIYPYLPSALINVNDVVARAAISEAGKIYYGISASGSGPKTPSEVKAGTGFISSGSVSASATVDTPIFASGLSAGTSYVIDLVAEDAIPNLQVSVVRLAFSTAEEENPPPPLTPGRLKATGRRVIATGR